MMYLLIWSSWKQNEAKLVQYEEYAEELQQKVKTAKKKNWIRRRKF